MRQTAMHTPLLLTLALASATVQLAAQITVVKPLDPLPPRRLEYHAPQLLSCPATQYPDSLKRRAIGGPRVVVLVVGTLGGGAPRGVAGWGGPPPGGFQPGPPPRPGWRVPPPPAGGAAG